MLKYLFIHNIVDRCINILYKGFADNFSISASIYTIESVLTKNFYEGIYIESDNCSYEIMYAHVYNNGDWVTFDYDCLITTYKNLNHAMDDDLFYDSSDQAHYFTESFNGRITINKNFIELISVDD